jgi:tetratricopeptide (TPR) repeat protein
VIERLAPRLDRLGYEDFFATPYLPILAHAYLHLGDIDRAEALVGDALRRVQRVENRLDVIAALLVQANLLERQGRGEEAYAVLQDVLRHAREMSFPAAEAEALFRLGSLEVQLGDMEAARPHVVQARKLWESLGARQDVARADEVLGKLPPAATFVRG